MKSLIIGKGEVGQALHQVLSKKFDVMIIDKEPEVTDSAIDIMHICFPYSKNFVKIVFAYQAQYKPQFTVIHSTVPIGTSSQCGAYHSPIRGVHPNLAEGIETFVKYLGPANFAIKEYFEMAGITIQLVKEAKTAEAIKLWDTTYYGWNIIFQKALHKWCDDNGADFDAIYTDANNTYNKGYTELDMANVVRPVLKYMEGGLKGHCVLENAVLLKELGANSEMIDLILSMGKHEDTISEEKPYFNKTWFYCEHFGKKRTLKDIGESCGTSGENIGMLAKRRGWKIRDNKWTEEQINTLISLSEDMSLYDLSKILVDKTYNAIRLKAASLGVKSIYSPGEETKKEEVRKKISATLQGISLEEWSGFVSTSNEEIRHGEEYRGWRESVFARDGYSCVRCGAKSVAGKAVVLNADHIKLFSLYPELRTEVNNGQTLCVPCHKVKTKEDWKFIREYNETL